MPGLQLRGRPPHRNHSRLQLATGTALLLLLIVAIGPSAGSATEPTAERYEFHGSALPYYFCVQGFYYKLLHARDVAPEAWVRQLEDLGIKYGSPSEAALRNAISRFEAEVAGRTQDLTPLESDSVAWEQAQTEHINLLVEVLRDIHVEALDQLEIDGHSKWDIDDYINRVIRPSVAVSSHPGLNVTDFETLAGLDDLTRGGVDHE